MARRTGHPLFQNTVPNPSSASTSLPTINSLLLSVEQPSRCSDRPIQILRPPTRRLSTTQFPNMSLPSPICAPLRRRNRNHNLNSSRAMEHILSKPQAPLEAVSCTHPSAAS